MLNTDSFDSFHLNNNMSVGVVNVPKFIKCGKMMNSYFTPLKSIYYKSSMGNFSKVQVFHKLILLLVYFCDFYKKKKLMVLL